MGDTINFSGSAQDAQDGQLPASKLSWSLVYRTVLQLVILMRYRTMWGLAAVHCRALP